MSRQAPSTPQPSEQLSNLKRNVLESEGSDSMPFSLKKRYILKGALESVPKTL